MEESVQLKENSNFRGTSVNNNDLPSLSDQNRRQNCVDFILVWSSIEKDNSSFDDLEENQNRSIKRETFEKNLRNEGLLLENEKAPEGCANGMNFVKITAPPEVLERYAEILKLRLPMKKVSITMGIQINLHNYYFCADEDINIDLMIFFIA